jgi:hypothetical protein
MVKLVAVDEYWRANHAVFEKQGQDADQEVYVLELSILVLFITLHLLMLELLQLGESFVDKV